MGHGASHSIQESVLKADSEAIREFAARGQIDKQDEDGWSSLHFAAFKDSVAVVRQLLQLGASVMLKDKMGRTALHLAAVVGSTGSIVLLCGMGADVSVQDSAGVPPLCKAAAAGNVKAVAELLVAGANPSVVLRDGATALHMAAWKGHADVLIKLLEHAVVIDAANDNGDTALHEAAQAGHLEAVKVLLDNNADVALLNQDGLLPQKLAEANGHSEVARLLALRHTERAASPGGNHACRTAAQEHSGVVSYQSVGRTTTATGGVVAYPTVGRRNEQSQAAESEHRQAADAQESSGAGYYGREQSSQEADEGVVSYPRVGGRAQGTAPASATAHSGSRVRPGVPGGDSVPSAPPLASMASRPVGQPPVQTQWDLRLYEDEDSAQDSRQHSRMVELQAESEGVVSYPSVPTRSAQGSAESQGAALREPEVAYPAVGRREPSAVSGGGSHDRLGQSSQHSASGEVSYPSLGRQPGRSRQASANQQTSLGTVNYPRVGAGAQHSSGNRNTGPIAAEGADWGVSSSGEDDGWGDPVGTVQSGRHRLPDGQQVGGQEFGRQGHSIPEHTFGPPGSPSNPEVPYGLQGRAGHVSAASVLAAQQLAQQEGRISQLTTQLNQLQMSIASSGGGGTLTRSAAPDVYCCPITQDVMEDPVLAADGYTYERMAIERWFRSGHRSSPMTNAALTSTKLHSNHALRSATAQFLSQLDEK